MYVFQLNVSFRSHRIIVYSLVAFSAINSVLSLYGILGGSQITTGGNLIQGTSPSSQPAWYQTWVSQAPKLAIGGWGFLAIASLWYQRTVSTWRKRGFGPDVFRLLVRTRGSETRVRLLESLSIPKTRLQLANELGHDWNVVDRNIKTLLKYGVVRESSAYGNVRLYELTETGKTVLKLIEELRGAP